MYPILSVVDALAPAAGRPNESLRPERARDAEAVELCYVGEAGGVEEGLATRAGIPFRAIETGQVRGQALWAAAQSLWRMRRGAAQCRAILADFRPDVVFLTGGYVAAPVAWAAWRMHVPILIYLPDVTPGQAIRLTAHLAARVAVSFPEVARYFGKKAVVTGYPVRRELLTTGRPAARAALGLTDDLPVLLVMGGSRGARSINRALLAGLERLLTRCQVVHVSGPLDWPEVAKAAAGLPAAVAGRYHPYPYLHEMPLALAAADLAVARAGAATLGEFPAVGLPAILVPYPYSGQHQEANAAYLADRGAALVIRDSELAGRLVTTVWELLDAPERRAAMAQAARSLARPAAAADIAAQLRELAGTRSGPTR
ncbi:MAG: glycosyltransferase [Anaerolineae bacterium]|nr:glycosyltransferase [Anaerolineae bacterium]